MDQLSRTRQLYNQTCHFTDVNIHVFLQLIDNFSAFLVQEVLILSENDRKELLDIVLVIELQDGADYIDSSKSGLRISALE